ncbi:MAG: hypothetical protein AAGG68_00045 [Bacteroidota bacterium]
MNDSLRILVEGEGDLVFMELVKKKIYTDKFIDIVVTKEDSVGNIANTLRDKLTNRLALGLVDNDKKQPKYLESFSVLKSNEDHRLLLKKHHDKKHYGIFFLPAFEKWLWETAVSLNIDPKTYGYSNLKGLQEITKTHSVHKNQKFKDFICRIRDKKNSPVSSIIRWIEEELK